MKKIILIVMLEFVSAAAFCNETLKEKFEFEISPSQIQCVVVPGCPPESKSRLCRGPFLMSSPDFPYTGLRFDTMKMKKLMPFVDLNNSDVSMESTNPHCNDFADLWNSGIVKGSGFQTSEIKFERRFDGECYKRSYVTLDVELLGKYKFSGGQELSRRVPAELCLAE